MSAMITFIGIYIFSIQMLTREIQKAMNFSPWINGLLDFCVLKILDMQAPIKPRPLGRGRRLPKIFMTFTAHGHKNVLSTHRNTIEFTHDKDLTQNGDCILGVEADYSVDKIKAAHFCGKIKIHMSVDNLSDEIIADYNPLFADLHEMVIRRSNYEDKRTFAIRADKAAKDIKREIVEKMKNPHAILFIHIEQS